MMFIGSLLSILFVLTHSQVTRQSIFQSTITSLTKQNKCVTNQILLTSYISNLKNNSIGVPNARQMKNQFTQYIQKLPFQRDFEGFPYESLLYNICKVEVKKRLRDPTYNLTNVDISITKMINTYPYLLPNLRPQKLQHLFNFLNDHMKAKCFFVEYLIINHKLYVKHWASGWIQRLHLDNIPVVLHQLPDMYFLHAARDQYHILLIKQWIQQRTQDHFQYDGLYESIRRVLVDMPTFLRSTDLVSELEFNKFNLVDTYILSDHWEKNRQQSLQTSAKIPWEMKKDIVFWRGAGSSKSYQDNNMFQNLAKFYPRLFAVNFSNSYPKLMDFKFTQDPRITDQQMLQHNITWQNSSFTSISQHMKYKYLISFDGYTAAWERIPWILMSSSILLKQVSYKVQWFYNQMIPNVHFVPIKQDMSDLVQKVQYMNKNPEYAKNIIKAANEFAKRFTVPQLYIDLANQLKQYASFQKLTRDEAQLLLSTRSFNFQRKAKYLYQPSYLHQVPNSFKQQYIIIGVVLVIVVLVLIKWILNRRNKNCQVFNTLASQQNQIESEKSAIQLKNIV